MHKILVAYISRTGMTEKMAQLIAEGGRFAGHQVDLKKIADIKKAEELEGYDGFVFGCPTYHRDMTAGMKTFLFLAQQVNMTGKIGGAFGAYTHSGESAGMIFDTMQHVFKMDMVDLGALNLKEHAIPTAEGAQACQQYGKAIGSKLDGK